MKKKSLEVQEYVGEKISKYFGCIMLFLLGVMILGIPIGLCFIFGIPLITYILGN